MVSISVFFFLYGYGAPLGGLSGHWSLQEVTHVHVIVLSVYVHVQQYAFRQQHLFAWSFH